MQRSASPDDECSDYFDLQYLGSYKLGSSLKAGSRLSTTMKKKIV